MIGITPQHFCRVFGKTINMRPNEYLTRIKIDEAKRLLCDKDISVAEASAQSGFRNSSYFSTVFRKYEGISPGEYRKKELNENSFQYHNSKTHKQAYKKN